MDVQFRADQNNLESIGLRVADHVSAMLAYWDKDLICRFANMAYLDWFGKTREEMVDKITIKELLGPLYEKNLPYISGALEGKVQTFEREIHLPHGGMRHAIANYFPDVVNGKVRGFYVHVADITHQKLLEQETVQSNKVIGDQNKLLLSFANIVSHNLKSYANNLKSILGLFLKADTEAEKTLMLNYLQSISKGFSTTVTHLTEIIDVQNQFKLKLEPINLRDYVTQSIEILSVQREQTHSIIHNLIEANSILLGNPAYVESILLNLLTNAIKYRQPDRTLVVELSAKLVNNELEVKVKDNGQGINLDKHRHNLFGMYKTFHGNADALGIGLFMTKLQTEAMGGRIDLESEEHVGTTFILHLPVGELK